MKKTVLVTLVFICGSLQAQNPDGRNASLHITPTLPWGNGNFHRNSIMISPQTMVTPTQFFIYSDTGQINYPTAFGINVMLKIPTASFLTVCLSYSYDQLFEEDNEYNHYWSLNGRIHKVSLTASIYNLFSVY
jgi:hypothetical protein